MDERIKRFKLCDLRFHPYLAGVIERLPEQVRNEVLDDTGFQILTDDDAPKACVLRYRFSEPVKTLVYLNTNLLRESRHQLIYTLASEIAHYVLGKRQAALDSGSTSALLREWGFEKEVAATRSNLLLCESRGYKLGYDWAKKQDRNYLMQHFGIYYDAWNLEAHDIPPGKTSESVGHGVEPGPILDRIIRLKQGEAADSSRDKFYETPSLKQEMLAGIMAAMRESSFTPRAGGLKKSS
jgi:hypothetical protein